MRMISLRVFLLAIFLVSALFIKVAKCEIDVDFAKNVDDGGGIGIVGENAQDTGDKAFSAAAGVETTYVFPQNSEKLVTAGEETELLAGIKNNGWTFTNGNVPTSATATYPYVFTVSKFLQPGVFDLVATVIYEIDQTPYQSTFYNSTIEVLEGEGALTIESALLVTFGVALLVFLGLWIHAQAQSFSKKSKKTLSSKVEVGTGTRDVSLDEWLQGTAYTQSLSSKSNKKK